MFFICCTHLKSVYPLELQIDSNKYIIYVEKKFKYLKKNLISLIEEEFLDMIIEFNPNASSILPCFSKAIAFKLFVKLNLYLSQC
ncbi:hypothetical protein BpHYR1_044100 [Brachionus plicatilis]|uniref:Uncharacterized protein n=1 Tax=Brachionus plicatilis TaxID=10195 RepID=A0A3M7RNH6_BRAPC|nr:hypothetical protein BpHYR1_044100 [Brachionus plicatilis]